MGTLPSREKRVDEAMLHEQECLAKYGAIFGRDRAYNFRLWWREVQYENGGYKYQVRENPKPYSNFYPQHFIEKYFSSGSENNLILNLEKDFIIGDKIDAEYIELLFITVKRHGLFEPGAIAIFDEHGPGSVELLPEGSYYGNRNVPSSQILTGSEANQGVVKAIRRWLKRRAKELAQTASKELPNANPAQAFSQLFALHFTLAHCDELMANVLVGPAFNKPANLSAKIWALLHVIDSKGKGLLNCTAAVAAPKAGNYYGYSMATKPSKVKDGEPYKDAYKRIGEAVRKDMADKKYGPNYSQITP